MTRSMKETPRLSDRLRAAREAKRLDVAAVAKALTVSPRTVQNWEHGMCSPRVDQAHSICDLFGVTPHWLIFGRERGRAA